jgi:hypothetical protein
MDALISQLVNEQQSPSAGQLDQIARHVAAAPFAEDLLVVDEPLWGGFWQGDVIAPGYQLPVVELALLRAVRLDKNWPEDTTVSQFLADLHRAILDPQAGIWLLAVAEQPCVLFVAGSSRSSAVGPQGAFGSGRRSTVYIFGLTLLLLMSLLAYRVSTNLPAANQRNRPDDIGLEPGWAILADQPEKPAIVSTSFEEKVALEYLQTVWQTVTGIYPTGAGELQPPAALSQAGLLRRYVTRSAATIDPDSLLGKAIYPQAAGTTLIALWPEPRRELPAGATPLDLDFGGQLKLVGWETVAIEDEAEEVHLNRPNWQVVLYWQAQQPIPVDYTVSVRPLAAGQTVSVEGEAVIQDHQPVWGFYPTSRWRPAELVRDVYALALPAAVTPDAVQIVVYRTGATGFENLAEATIEIFKEPGGQ